MLENIFIQILITVGSMAAGLFALIKYMVSENRKRETSLLDTNKEREATLLEYFEKKNGHIERIAGEFSKTTRESTKALYELSTEIRILRERKND